MPGAAEKAKGRSAENAIVEYLNRQLAVTVERRRLSGVNDKGDIAGLPGTVIEVKNQARMDLAGWVGEAERERQNAGAAFGVVWHKRKGKSDPGEWYVTMSGDTFCGLLDFVLPHLGGRR